MAQCYFLLIYQHIQHKRKTSPHDLSSRPTPSISLMPMDAQTDAGFTRSPTAPGARALMATGIQADQLGGLVKIGEVLPGNPHAQGSEFAQDLEVVMAGNDHAAGAVGSGCSARRSILTLGTAGVLYRHAGNHPGPYSGRGGSTVNRCLPSRTHPKRAANQTFQTLDRSTYLMFPRMSVMATVFALCSAAARRLRGDSSARSRREADCGDSGCCSLMGCGAS